MTDHLDSTNLMPFKRRRRNGYHLPDLQGEQEEQIIDEVDPELRPEEQGFVRHYLAYADILLRKSAETAEGELLERNNTLPRHQTTEISTTNGFGIKSSKNNAA